MEEIQRADPAARRRAIAAVAVGATLGGAALMLLEQQRGEIAAWLTAGHFRAKLAALLVSVVAGFIPLLLGAIWVWRLGNRVIREGRHPPSGLKVLRDVPVLRGMAARRRGRAYQGIALLLIVAAGAMVCLGLKVFFLFGGKG